MDNKYENHSYTVQRSDVEHAQFQARVAAYEVANVLNGTEPEEEKNKAAAKKIVNYFHAINIEKVEPLRYIGMQYFMRGLQENCPQNFIEPNLRQPDSWSSIPNPEFSKFLGEVFCSENLVNLSTQNLTGIISGYDREFSAHFKNYPVLESLEKSGWTAEGKSVPFFTDEAKSLAEQEGRDAAAEFAMAIGDSALETLAIEGAIAAKKMISDRALEHSFSIGIRKALIEFLPDDAFEKVIYISATPAPPTALRLKKSIENQILRDTSSKEYDSESAEFIASRAAGKDFRSAIVALVSSKEKIQQNNNLKI